MEKRQSYGRSLAKLELLAIHLLKNVAAGVEVNLQTLRETLAMVPQIVQTELCRNAVENSTFAAQENILQVLSEAGALYIEKGQVVEYSLKEVYYDFRFVPEALVEKYNNVVSTALSCLANSATLPQNKLNEQLRKAASAEAVRALLDAGAEPSYYGCYGSTALHEAAYCNRPDSLRVLLERGGDKLARTSEGRTLLHAAAIAGSKSCIEILLEAELDENAKDNFLLTPLHFASGSARSADCVAILLAAGACVNAKDRFEMTPLHYAAIDGTEETVKVLVEAFADLKAVDVWFRTPGNAVFNESVPPERLQSRASISCLLNSVGSSYNIENDTIEPTWDVEDCFNRRRSALTNKAMQALKNLSQDATAKISKGELQNFLRKEKDLHVSYIACKALQSCCEEGRFDIVHLFMMHGTTPDARESSYWLDEIYGVGGDPNWLTWDRNNWPLIHLAAAGGHVKTIEVLDEAGASLERVGVFDYPDPFGPLEAAAAHGHLTAVKVLLIAGCLGDRPQINGALRLAVTPENWNDDLEGWDEKQRTLLVMLLLNAGADPNSQDMFGHTALLGAAFVGWSDCLALLIQRGGDVSIQTKNGVSALHIASRHCHILCINVLIEAGADVSVKDSAGQTPLHYFAEGRTDGKWEYTPWLRSAGADSVQALVNAGANLEAVDNEGATALHLAANSLGGSTVIQELLRIGAHVNAQDRNGRTPLHYAAEAGVKMSVQILMEAGADPNIKDFSGDTPRNDARKDAILLLRPDDVDENDDWDDDDILDSWSGGSDEFESDEDLSSSAEDTEDDEDHTTSSVKFFHREYETTSTNGNKVTTDNEESESILSKWVEISHPSESKSAKAMKIINEWAGRTALSKESCNQNNSSTQDNLKNKPKEVLPENEKNTVVNILFSQSKQQNKEQNVQLNLLESNLNSQNDVSGLNYVINSQRDSPILRMSQVENFEPNISFQEKLSDYEKLNVEDVDKSCLLNADMVCEEPNQMDGKILENRRLEIDNEGRSASCSCGGQYENQFAVSERCAEKDRVNSDAEDSFSILRKQHMVHMHCKDVDEVINGRFDSDWQRYEMEQQRAKAEKSERDWQRYKEEQQRIEEGRYCQYGDKNESYDSRWNRIQKRGNWIDRESPPNDGRCIETSPECEGKRERGILFKPVKENGKLLTVTLHKESLHNREDRRFEPQNIPNRHRVQREWNEMSEDVDGSYWQNCKQRESEKEMWERTVHLSPEETETEDVEMEDRYLLRECEGIWKRQRSLEELRIESKRITYINYESRTAKERQEELDRSDQLHLSNQYRQDSRELNPYCGQQLFRISEDGKLEVYGYISSSSPSQFSGLKSRESHQTEDNRQLLKGEERPREPSRWVSDVEVNETENHCGINCNWEEERQRYKAINHCNGCCEGREQRRSKFHHRFEDHSRAESQDSNVLGIGENVAQDKYWDTRIDLDTRSREKRIGTNDYEGNNKRNEFLGRVSLWDKQDKENIREGRHTTYENVKEHSDIRNHVIGQPKHDFHSERGARYSNREENHYREGDKMEQDMFYSRQRSREGECGRSGSQYNGSGGQKRRGRSHNRHNRPDMKQYGRPRSPRKGSSVEKSYKQGKSNIQESVWLLQSDCKNSERHIRDDMYGRQQHLRRLSEDRRRSPASRQARVGLVSERINYHKQDLRHILSCKSSSTQRKRLHMH